MQIDLIDTIVVGAGPAGSAIAFLLAKRGYKVTLLDKAKFPRSKVCGSCINGKAMTCLNEMGLGDLLSELGALSVDELCLYTDKRRGNIDLPEIKVISRLALDSRLVDRARLAGATFLEDATATIEEKVDEESRSIVIEQGSQVTNLRSKVIIVADGIAGLSLRNLEGFEATVANDSRVGAGLIIEARSEFYKAGRIYMASGKGGYVGLVRIENNRLDVACALDVGFVRQCKGPGYAASRILEETSLPVPVELVNGNWQGTVPLTRQRKKVSGERLFVIGDAASYAEPFTGEGIAWALGSAQAVVPFIEQAIESWSSDLALGWQMQHRELLLKRQHTSGLLAKMLRSNLLTNMSLGILNVMPGIARPLVRHISAGA